MATVTIDRKKFSLTNTCPTDTALMEALVLWEWDDALGPTRNLGLPQPNETGSSEPTMRWIKKALAALAKGDVEQARTTVHAEAPIEK